MVVVLVVVVGGGGADGNAFTEICSVIESSQEVVW